MIQRPALTLGDAKAATAAALTAAAARNLCVAVSIVDDGGRMVCFERMDGVIPKLADQNPSRFHPHCDALGPPHRARDVHGFWSVSLGISWGSGEVAHVKAVSAAAYRRDTLVFDDRLTGGRLAVLGQPCAFPIQGGLPILVSGHCIGAIGVSGALAAEDTQIAQAGIAALLGEGEQ